MKVTKLVNLLVIALVVIVAVAGCRKRPSNLTPLPGSRTAQTRDLGPGEAIGGGTTTGSEVKPEDNFGVKANPAGSHDGWTENAETFKANIIYFDLDSSVIKGSQKVNIEAVANYLKANTSAAVRVEGHCDERGTEEYNRSLGERRAIAVREALVASGIDSTRVDTTSYGEDRPADPGQGEAAWKKNRRGEFILLTPP